MNVLDQLPHITSRIEAFKPNGEMSLGTGFFFRFHVPDKGAIITLVTNKHVISGATRVKIYVSKESEDRPVFGEPVSIEIDKIDRIVIEHPSRDVDLAAFPVGEVIAAMDRAGTPPFIRSFDLANLPSEETIHQLTAVEDILMVGYPAGVWDKANNLPIIRRGITATPYARDYEGRPEFMIDCACFPGSSGSPVIIASNGSFSTHDGAFMVGTRLYLLGLLWGGPQYTTEGRIVARPAPTSVVPISVSEIPTNLGYCVKARMIRDLEPLVLARFG